MKVNEYGIVQYDEQEALELLFQGYDIKNISLIDSELFDKLAVSWDVPQEKSFEDAQQLTIKDRAQQWLFDYPEFDVRADLISKCKNDKEIERINLEMDLFEQRNLLPILRLMYFLVDHFRKNNIVWGVGRGSSVSSYVLFKIGIHRIDSLRYDLDIKDFLKD